MDRLQLIGRVARVAVTAVLAVLAVAGPAVALAGHRQGWQPLIERTGSMAPALTPGDLVLTDRQRASDARPGDVLTFADPHVPGRTITHRLVSVARAGDVLRMTTRGDANRAAETWTIPAGGTVGRLRAHVALPGAAATLMDRSPARGVVLALLSLLACGLTLRAIWRRPTRREPGACAGAR